MDAGALLKLFQKKEHEVEEVIREYTNTMLFGELLTNDLSRDEDYQGAWEDAFLFSGYENGKFGFLTGFVALSIKRHGFKVYTSATPDQLAFGLPSENVVIRRLVFNDQECIPDTDVSGNPVIIGVTDPRTYLPKEIQIILDDEFGYDRDIYDPHR